ncbi:ABC transporter permease [Polaromonas sp. JS666]|uniref:ABC transporter permease n=1 Tax=Polaromonas sp. (strain JS666 / ATCC BAA-500) TaxID=296591 RepID=UPI0000535C3B|nr:ABC transporter permease [Polaromonas sp. JS666]ABE42346.1 binding-protein-dependent transport systems inner membrane component [Polaromonas sp. JS666]
MAALTASSSADAGISSASAAPAMPSASLPAQRSRGYWTAAMLRFVHDPVAVGAVLVVLMLIAMAIFGPWLAPADPYDASMLKRLKPIGTAGLPLGSDELGRDMLSRLIMGARLSLFIGITPVILAFFTGSVIGIVAGYAGGIVNTAIMRTIDVFYAFPSVLLAIALSGVLGAGVVNSLISLTIVFIPQIARVAESVTTQVRGRDYVEAARASGANAFTIVRVHVLGNVLGPIFVYATSLIAVSMILASGLSFLGLGVKPPEPEWGLMLNTLRTALYVQPWVAALPGVMIFITSIAFNILSDGLRSAMDNKG